RVEGLDAAVVQIAVARRRIELRAEPRFPRRFGERVAAERADCPRAHRLAAQAAGLPHAFGVPVEAARGADPAHVETAPMFLADTCRKVCVVVSILGERRANLTTGEALPLQANAAIHETAIAEVVEGRRVAILHWLAHEAAQAPVATLIGAPDGVV